MIFVGNIFSHRFLVLQLVGKCALKICSDCIQYKIGMSYNSLKVQHNIITVDLDGFVFKIVVIRTSYHPICCY